MFTFRRATRTAVKIKTLLLGPSGSGKTLGGLRMAEGLVSGPGKIACIDTEHDRSGYYADQIEFDSLSLAKASPASIIEAIRAAESAGYEACVIDSLSHAWQDVLDRKEKYDTANKGSNGWANWKRFSAEWDVLVRAILESPLHVICTARSKQAYEQVEEGGKKKIVKMGLEPTIRAGTEYEFALVFEILESHAAMCTKDNTSLFSAPDVLWNLCDGTVPSALRAWMSMAIDVARPMVATSHAIDDAISAITDPARQEKARARWAKLRSEGQTEDQARAVLAKLVAQSAPSVQNLARLRDEVAKVHEAAGLPVGDEPVTAETRTAIMDTLMYLEAFKARPGVQDFINQAARMRMAAKMEGEARQLLALAEARLAEMQQPTDVAA